MPPSIVASRLSGMPWFIWLDSEKTDGPLANWSFIAVLPQETVEVYSDRTEHNGQISVRNLFDILRMNISPDDSVRTTPLHSPFVGGWMGYLAYDYGSKLIDWQSRHSSQDALAAFGFYSAVLAWDHEAQTCQLICVDDTEETRSVAQHLLEAHSGANDTGAKTSTFPDLNWQEQETSSSFVARVEKVQNLIAQGDIYQANLSHTLHAELRADMSPFDHYLVLRTENAAPFSAFLNYPGRVIASTSPERFIEVRDRKVEARPIKGTIHGSPDPQIDTSLRAELTASAKDRAENIMIVDLLRNDLSRVCQPHSVQTPDICKLESYKGLHHLVSSVTGHLKTGYDGLDLVAAAFPGGSITGAPKLRAMEIIDELETSARGIYCGSIGYFGVDGALDLSISIRTLTYKDNQAELKVGGGITQRSDPQKEYEETQVKAARIIGKVQG